MKKRILITGATGMLGASLAKRFQKDYQVFATASSIANLDFIENFRMFDLASESFSELMDWSKPDMVIHCAALTNGNYCEQHPDEAFNINGIALRKISESVPKNTHVIYISTDAVFANDKHNASESDCVNPENVYGKSKELGEFFLRDSEMDFTIVRTTIVGMNLNKNRQGFAEWIINSSRNNTDISLFDDVLFTPISIWNLADQLEYIVKNREQFAKQTFHIAGSQACTKYEFGMALLKALNLSSDKVKKGKITDFADRAKRSIDQTLDCERFEHVSKNKLPTLEQTVEDLKNNYNEAY